LEQLFRFDLQVPGKMLSIRIDTIEAPEGSTDPLLSEPFDYSAEKSENEKQETDPVISALVTGQCLTLSDINLAYLTLRFPFSTLAVIGLIHWHAFLLWLKKVPFHMKEQNVNLQKEVLNPHPSLQQKDLDLPASENISTTAITTSTIN
jgi:hypothetical protein